MGDDADEPDSDSFAKQFAGVPFLGDLAGMFGGDGEQIWEAARQTATQIAAENKTEHNVDPAIRHRLDELVRVAELHVGTATQLDASAGGQPPQTEPVTRSLWAADALTAVRPLMERLAERVAAEPDEPGAQGMGGGLFGGAFGGGPNPLEGLMRMMSPMTVAMTAGVMAGHLARQAFGSSDLIVPRDHNRVLIATANVVEFASEWSLDVDDVLLWVAVREHAWHSVLSVPGVRDELDLLQRSYIEGFHRNDDPMALLEELAPGGLDLESLEVGNPESDPQFGLQLEKVFSNPDLLLGVARAESQDETVSWLEGVLGVLAGYVEDVLAQAGPRLIGGFDALSEAVRRRQVGSQGTEYADRLLGMRLSPQARERGAAFVAGVIELGGREALSGLWQGQGALPTPTEISEPKLWLERVGLASS